MVSAVTTWTKTSDKDFDNGTSENITIVGGGSDAELQISDLILWDLQNPIGGIYNKRSFAMSSIFNEDKVMMFGGENLGCFNDTWIYDVSNNTWSQKTPSNKPIARSFPDMAPVFGTKKVVLFGGKNETVSFNDTWIYDLDDNSWTLKTPMNHPSARYFHAMATVYGQDKVVLYGGYALSSGFPNETWVYDLSDDNWTLQSPANNPGGMVAFVWAPHVMANVYGQDKIVLYTGGSSPGETWVYDVSDDDWTNKTPTINPPPRTRTAISPISGTDNLMLFGGYDYPTTIFDDTWKYDLSDNKWIQLIPLNPSIKPTKRQWHKSATVYGTNKVVLCGLPPYNIFIDTWIYRHPPEIKNGTYLSDPYDTGSKSDFKTISWYANIPKNTTINFQIRTAANESLLTNQPFVGPDGVNHSFYNSSPTDIWSGHNGDRWVQYKAYFSIKMKIDVIDSPSLKDVTISYNCIPNTIVLSPVDDALLINNKPNFKWTFEDFDSEKQKAFQVIIANDINFSSIDFDSGEQNTDEERWVFPTGTNYTELPEGSWYWKVRTKDVDDKWTEFSLPWKIRIDTHAPKSVPDFPAENGYYQTVDMISGIANEAATGSGLNKIEIAIKRFNDNNYWNGTAWIALPDWLLATGTSNWIYDTNNIEWISRIKYSIQSRATDNANNVEQPTVMNIFTIDTDSPKSNIENPVDNNWLNKLDTISGNSFDMTGSGIDRVEICIKCSKDYNSNDDGPKKNNYWDGTAWITKEIWASAIGTTQWSYNITGIPWTTGDHYTIQSRAIDKINNVETIGQFTTFMYDDKPPENIAIHINNNDEFTKSTGVTVSLQAQDIGSGLSQMAFSNHNGAWSQWEPFEITRSFELSSVEGNRTIHFKVRDFTGNIAEPVSDTIVLDTVPPEELSIVINDNLKYTNSSIVTFSLNAIDEGSGVSGISFSYDSASWLPWESNKEMKSFTLPAGDGEKTIYLRAMDNAGNTAEPVFDTIIVDTLPPFSLSILVNDGLPVTNSTSVTLTLQAHDSSSGIDKISFSTDNESWSDWEDYLETRTYELPAGDGIKTIYFRAKDMAGNEAVPVSETIILNTTIQEKEIPIEKKATSNLDFWMIIFFIAIIIFTSIIVNMVVIMKRKQHTDYELLPSGALIIRPGGLIGPVVSVEQMTKTIEQPRLPSVSAIPAKVPVLAKSTLADTTVVTTQVPQSLPALPPIKIQEGKSEISSTTTASIPKPTVVIQTPSPKPSLANITIPEQSETQMRSTQTQPSQVVRQNKSTNLPEREKTT